jgi:hypothetical protein
LSFDLVTSGEEVAVEAAPDDVDAPTAEPPAAEPASLSTLAGATGAADGEAAATALSCTFSAPLSAAVLAWGGTYFLGLAPCADWDCGDDGNDELCK